MNMRPEKKPRIKRILLLIPGFIAAGIICLCFAGFLIINSYLNKINYDLDEPGNSQDGISYAGESYYETNDWEEQANTAGINFTEGDGTPGAGEHAGTEEGEYADGTEPDEYISGAPKAAMGNRDQAGKPDEAKEAQPVFKQASVIKNDNIENILLIGSDEREKNSRGRSDAMILVSLDKKSKKITLTSIMRDIYLYIPGKGNNRINAAYAFGGAELLINTIKYNFGIEVDKYLKADFYTFISAIDTLGGIEIELTEKEMEAMNGSIGYMNILNREEKDSDKLKGSGLQLLNGKQALSYVRLRKVGNSDFDRTKRQRRVLEEIFKRVKNMSLLEMGSFADAILPGITTNMTKKEIFAMILKLPSYAKYDMQELRIPVEGSYNNVKINGMSVLEIDFDKNIDEIRRKIYNK